MISGHAKRGDAVYQAYFATDPDRIEYEVMYVWRVTDCGVRFGRSWLLSKDWIDAKKHLRWLPFGTSEYWSTKEGAFEQYHKNVRTWIEHHRDMVEELSVQLEYLDVTQPSQEPKQADHQTGTETT